MGRKRVLATSILKKKIFFLSKEKFRLKPVRLHNEKISGNGISTSISGVGMKCCG